VGLFSKFEEDKNYLNLAFCIKQKQAFVPMTLFGIMDQTTLPKCPPSPLTGDQIGIGSVFTIKRLKTIWYPG
jgi:hypothetical protein